jgi:serine/threonine-protein kinase SRPK3
MLSSIRTIRHARNSPFLPRRYLSNQYKVINSSHLVEEETWPWYRPEEFYAARIGEVLHSKYQIVGKLGYGSYGTVWLCKDLMYATNHGLSVD